MQHDEPWCRTFGGHVISLSNPTPDQINFTDIVWPLAKTVRYNGHIKNTSYNGKKKVLHYSVAEHSVLLMERILKDYPEDYELAMQALMHDAAEAYVGDLVRPLKVGMPEFKSIEDRILQVIFERLNISWPLADVIHEYDTRILLDEEAQALNDGRSFGIDAKPLGVTLRFYSPERAFNEFIDAWGILKVRREAEEEAA